MAEIGLVGSILAVIQISASITTTAWKYGQDVARAKKQIEQVASELGDLTKILEQLKDLATRAEESEESCMYPTLSGLKL